MTRKLTNLLLVVLLLLVIAMLVLVVGTTWFLWKEKPAIESGIRATNATVHEVGLTAKNLREASAAWKTASEQQSQYVTRVLGSSQATFASIQTLVRRTDASLNESVLPNLAASVKEQNQALLKTQEDLRANLLELNKASQQLNKVLSDADAQINNPAIASTLENIDAATKNAADGLGEATKSLTDVRQIADKARETYLRPVNLWWAAVQKLLGIGPPIVTAIK